MSFAAFKKRMDAAANETNCMRQAESDVDQCSFSGRCRINFERATASIRENSFGSRASDAEEMDILTEYVPEEDRLHRLQEIQPAFQLEGSEPFDSIVKLARRMFRVPICLVSLVYDDFQWFKARTGLMENQTSRCVSFCAHTFESAYPEVLYIPDATLDDRFKSNSLVQGGIGIRFYCGVPLVTPDHYRIGALCIIDDYPRTITQEQIRVLINLAEVTVRELLKTETGRRVCHRISASRLNIRALIRSMPRLGKAQALRELWFDHTFDEGVMILDGQTHRCRVCWASPYSNQMRECTPQQSFWSLFWPLKVMDSNETYEDFMQKLEAGESHVTFLAQIIDRPKDALNLVEDRKKMVRCRVLLAENQITSAASLIHFPRSMPTPMESSPIVLDSQKFLILRWTLLYKHLDAGSKSFSGEHGGASDIYKGVASQ